MLSTATALALLVAVARGRFHGDHSVSTIQRLLHVAEHTPGEYQVCKTRVKHRINITADLEGIGGGMSQRCHYTVLGWKRDEPYCVRGPRGRQGDSESLHVPPDAGQLCGIIGHFMQQSRLPRTPEKIRAAGLWMVDAGAAFGGEALVGSAMGFRVLAVEGRPEEARRLQKECGSLKGVSIVNALLSDNSAPTTKRFFNAGDSSSMIEAAVMSGDELKKRDRIAAEGGDTVLNVEAMSLKHMITSRSITGRIALLKIDVQGFELEVILGALPILVDDKPILHFEYSPNFRGKDAPLVLCAVLYAGYNCVSVRAMITCVHPDSPRYA